MNDQVALLMSMDVADNIIKLSTLKDCYKKMEGFVRIVKTR